MHIDVKESEVIKIPDGVYSAKTTAFTEREGLQYGPAVSIVFEITDERQSGTVIDLLCARKLTKSPKAEKCSKLYRAVKALIGFEPQGSIDMNTLIGKECKILVSNDPDSDWSKITQVIPR